MGSNWSSEIATNPVNKSIPNSHAGWRVIAWLILSQVIGLLSLLPWLVFAGLAIMAFDSGVTLQAEIFVGAIWSYPLLPVGTAILAWILFAIKKYKAALIVTSLPLLLAVPLIGYIVFVMISNAFGG